MQRSPLLGMSPKTTLVLSLTSVDSRNDCQEIICQKRRSVRNVLSKRRDRTRPPCRQTRSQGNTGVCLWKKTPFLQAVDLQSRDRNCCPAPDSMLGRLIFQCVFFSGGVFFSETPVGGLADGSSQIRAKGQRPASKAATKMTCPAS